MYCGNTIAKIAERGVKKKKLYFGNPIAKIGESRKKIVCNVVLPKLVRLGERKKKKSNYSNTSVEVGEMRESKIFVFWQSHY